MDGADLQHVPAAMLPGRLGELHLACDPDDRISVWLPSPSALARPSLDDLLAGAGFSIERRETTRRCMLLRHWTLPDTVAPGMRVLVSGLNPSPAAADSGVGFARPGNRFWPAAIAAGLVTQDRDPQHGLSEHGVGMTDIVKRTTRRADELSASEYRDGLARVERLVAWLQPMAVCFIGLAGWRVVIDRQAPPGWQASGIGGRPTYLMPSTSGLNASSQLPDFTEHLRNVARGH